MKRRDLLGALTASCLPIAACLPTATSSQIDHLSDTARKAIFSERFRPIDRVDEIPAAIMAAAAAARGAKESRYPFQLANPGESYQSTDVIVTPGLPGRRLVVAFASYGYWIVHYEAGGVAHSYHVALFALRDGHARFLWHARLQHKLSSIDDVRRIIHGNDPRIIDDTYTSLY